MELQIGESAKVDGQEKYWSGENYEWQSKEQHEKLKEEGKFKFGAQALDRIQSSAVNAIGGENLVKMAQGFSAVSEPLSKVLKFNPQLSGLYQAQENVGELTSQASGAASDALNVDKRITDTAAVAAEAFLTGGGPGAVKRAGGKVLQAVDDLIPQQQLQMQLVGATNAGSFARQQMDRLMPPTVMKAVTTTNREVLDTVGVKTGDNIITPEQGKRLIKRSSEIENKKGAISRINEDIEALRELKGDPKNLQKYINESDDFLKSYWESEGGDVDKIIRRLTNAKERAQPALSQAQSNVGPFAKEGDFQQWYKTIAGKNARSAEAKARGIKQVLQEHHLFPKGISAAYFDAMDRLIAQGRAKADDLVLMFEYAVKKGRTPGDYKVNIKNLPPEPHGTLHNQGFRTKGYKAELPKSDYVNQLKDVKDVDDLMQRWVDVLDDDVAYQMDTAQIWEDMGKLIAETQK